ncbi:MAG: polysaccharide biosynthesis tyrosine autokinase [Pirellulales bacterium]|nr:polysaccharide biosynthesis tyrosine autokinase [Pirellulales bacterium]
MAHEPTIIQVEADEPAQSHLVHGLLHFALVVRYRWRLVAACLVVSGLFGALYHTTATRFYRAKAALVVIETGGEQASTGVTGEGPRQLNTMPTYTSLLSYPKVLEGALTHLDPKKCVDLADTPPEKWTDLIRLNLLARSVRGTNIIEVSYLSRDPANAVDVVNAVVASYREFLNKTHRGAAGEIGRVLTHKMGELEAQIARTQKEVLEAQQKAGDLRLREDGRTLHPLVQRATSFNEELITVQKQRLQLENSLSAIETALRSGEDLQPHVMRVADVVGREMLMRSLGFNPRDTATQAALERDLLEDRARLQTLQEHLGPGHSEVLAMVDRIRLKENYLADYPRRVSQWLTQVQDTQLGPKLVEMVRERLDEARRLETSLQTQYEHAQAEAAQLNVLLTDLDNKERDLKRLRAWQEQLLNKLTDVNLRQEGQDVRTEIVQDPTLPTSPVEPNRRRVALFSLFIGLGAALVLVYVVDTLDDRFRSVEELQRQLGTGVLAMVGRLAPLADEGLDALQVHVLPDAAASEAFRTLRTALSLADREATRLVVSSAEPGDGKTTVLANLAAACAHAQKKTLLIDADLRRPGLTTLLGLRGEAGLSNALHESNSVARAAAEYVRASGINGLDVLPSGPRPGNPSELLAHPRLGELLAWAETVYDQILIDSPPALATSDAALVGRLVDGAILVVQPGKNRRRQVIRCRERFTAWKIPVVGVVLNRLDPEHGYGYYGYGGREYGYTSREETVESETTRPTVTAAALIGRNSVYTEA